MEQEICREYSDEQLAQEAALDQRYFACLIERYEERLLRFIMRMSDVSREEAEDILQEAFLKSYMNLHGFDSSLSFSSWMYRITRNEVISSFRKRKARPHGNSVQVEDRVIQAFAADLDITAETEQRLLRDRLELVLDRLDDKHQEVLVLKFFEERSYGEIADILRKPPGTVASLISRAKKHAKVAWEEIDQDRQL